MKKMLCMLLALLLCPLAALAEDSSGAILTWQELSDWAQAYCDKAMTTAPMNNPADAQTAEGYEYVFDFGKVYADSPVMSADTAVNAVVLTSQDEAGLRNVNIGSDMSVVLNAFYSENAQLLGTKESAVLYTVDQLPVAAMWGEVFRDGQRVETIQYAVHEQLATGGEGYTDAGVIFTMVENRVSAVRVYGLNSRISLQDVNQVMYKAMLGALEMGYAQVPTSYDGAALTAFGAEDLVFSGLDFLNITPNEAIDLLGEPMSDEWVDNRPDGYIRVQTYADCELTYLFNEARTQGHLYMLAIHADGLEGPRAVRYGDTFASVYNRFRSGEGELDVDAGSELLYGQEGEGPFGEAAYGNDASATLRYGFTLEDGRAVTLKLEFSVMKLNEIMLFVD
ncbi:MAG: hypothetical protein IJB81_10055 [Clostridia bacterium]|nr:hypothetical protein [Clostridia bacterium]